MNMQQLLLKMSTLALLLLNSAVLFGMQCHNKGVLTTLPDKKRTPFPAFDSLVDRLNSKQLLLKNEPENNVQCREILLPSLEDRAYYQPQVNLPLEKIVDVAARADNNVKNNIQITCKFFNEILSKKKSSILSFMQNSFFTCRVLDLEDIRLNALWHGFENKNKILNLVDTWIGVDMDNNSIISLADIPKLKNICRTNQIDTFLEERFQLSLNIDAGQYNKEINDHNVLADMLFFAVWSNDCIAMKIISLKIKDFLYNMFGPDYCNEYTYNTYKDLLISFVTYDKSIAFEFILKQNPYGAIGSKYESEKQSDGQQLFLDWLSANKDISQFLKDKYSCIYKKYGGTTFEEVNNKKQSNWKCVIQ